MAEESSERTPVGGRMTNPKVAKEESEQEPSREMKAERTTMEDGRYMIYYTFDPIFGPGFEEAPSEAAESSPDKTLDH